MIQIKDKSLCCGCSACAQRCPKQCISLASDEEGFLYPEVNTDACIDCGLCEKTCPVLKGQEPLAPASVYAAKACSDDVRLKSSSGGIFSLIADYVLSQGGVVFGAAFDSNWAVRHIYISDKKDLHLLMGSKYVQSEIGNTYNEAESLLKAGRNVLFSGTPCQIAGLKQYLRKEYENLLTVDIVCHGVPSPLVWDEYKKTIPAKRVDGKYSVSLSLKDIPSITGISFRDKRNGWQIFGFAAQMSASKADKNTVLQHYEPKDKNPYLVGFLSNIFLRPSCYKCGFKQGRSHADITLADFWGAKNEHPDIYDDKGISCIIAYNRKAESIIESLDVIKELSTIEKFTGQNPAYLKPHAIPANREKFWPEFHRKGVLEAINKYARQSTKEYIRSMIIVLIGKLGLINTIKKIIGK